MLVGIVNCVGHRGDQFGRLLKREPMIAFAKDARQRSPGYELLHEVDRPVVGLTGLVQRDDAGMFELGRAPGLADKPCGVFLAGQAARSRGS